MSDATPYDGKDPGPYWHDQLKHAEKLADDWETRGDKVVKRYRDERATVERARTKFNILWSNTQVLSPSLYGRPAKPEVSRRYMDSDPVGRLASMMLERVLEYEVDQFPDFGAAMTGCVEDRLLPGRGTAWIRLNPDIDKPPGEVDAAYSPTEYVYWKDFRHSPARIWDEVWWVARRVYMTNDEGVARFGKVFKNVPLNASQAEDTIDKSYKRDSSFAKKAEVWEIWSKRTKKVCWIAKDYPQSLDEKDDYLLLEGFFPCPKPLFATTTNGSLIPVPDYCEYEDQARELDSITARISFLVKAVKAVGCFNAEYKELGRLLTEGIDNKLVPVQNWQALSEKGGLKGAVDMLDITVVLTALNALYAARESVKQTIYEICGISDILRGATDAQETLGAQQLKANFGSLRLRDSQKDVARFASDLFRLKAQVICKFYPPELIMKMSGIQNTDDGQNQQMMQQALQMLQNSTVRDFSIQVESDSLAQIDDQEEKQAASEAIQAIGGFIKEAIPMVGQAPETLPMVSEMLLFLVRRFRAGRGLESAIERAMKALEAKAQQAMQNPQPSDAEIEAKAKMQADQARVQADVQAAQQKAQFDSQVQQGKLQMEMSLEQMKSQQELQLAKLEGQLKLAEIEMHERTEKWKAQLQADTAITVAEIGAEASRQKAAEAAKQKETVNA